MATQAQLDHPSGVFVSSSNKEVYFADSNNHRIRKILKNGSVVTIAGNGQKGFVGDYGSALSAKLNTPTCVFVSLSNEVYIADSENHRIRKILMNGDIITIAGNGKPGFSGDNGLATKAQLNRPMSVFVSASNEVYIADSNNNRIRKILASGIIVTIAGNGQKGCSGDDDIATNAQLYGPAGIFVSSNNEVYIADFNNHKVRKISDNGIIKTIAGNGTPGCSGDGIATFAQLYGPTSIFVMNDEVYIADSENHRIRKILANGDIVTIAGNKKAGFSGDNAPSTNSKLYNPTSVFVALNNDVYIADKSNHRIRKILENGNITTIAGNEKQGYSGDSTFDISKCPHIGGSIYPVKKGIFKLKKYERDLLFNSSVYAFIPLIEILSPFFCKHILKKEQVINSMNSTQQEIIQKLVDSLIYEDETELKFNDDELLDVLYILGVFKNNEFIILKKSCITRFIQSLNIQNLSLEWEQVVFYISQCNTNNLNNYILEYLRNYCVEFAAIQMKSSEGYNTLQNIPIIVENTSNIQAKKGLAKPNPITLDEKIYTKSMTIETLFNDKKTSDLKIRVSQKNFIYCHRTILSSSSTFFHAIFNSGATFTDLNNDTFIPDPSDDLELLEVVIKTCYGIPVKNVKSEKIISLLDMAMKHEMAQLVNFCKKKVVISIENYFDLVLAFENYFDLEIFESVYNSLLVFGAENRKKLFFDCDTISSLPPKLLHAMFLKISQE